ncbi:MAG: FtsW/RodA/SpoVE family cell cycle protein [Candidatus Bruticola sp.]
MKFEYFNKPITSTLFVVIAVLVCFGLLIVLSASIGLGALSPDYNYSSLHFFNRQVLFFIIGSVLMFCIYKWFDFSKWRQVVSLPLVCLTAALQIWALLSSSVNEVNRWASVGGVQFQPGEFAKLAIILFWADFLARNYEEIVKAKESPLSVDQEVSSVRTFSFEWLQYNFNVAYKTFLVLWPALAVSAVLLALIEMGKDLGTIVVIGVTIFMMLIAVGTPWQFTVGSSSLAFLCGVLMIFKESYRMSRLSSWLDPMSDPQGIGYQACNSFLAIGSGGIWGVGFPFSRQKFDFVPEMHCDFIYAIICEELGLIGSLGLLLIFLVLIMCCIEISFTCPDPYKALIAFGISLQIVGQTLFNIGVVTGLLPNKGLPLPFVSAGGSSLIVTMVSMGLMLNISTNSNTEVKTRPIKVKKPKAIREGATLSSSDQQSSVHHRSTEWEAIASSKCIEPRSSIPLPVVDPSLSDESDIKDN